MDTSEFSSLSIDDIELILRDQRDLYSEEELAFLEERLAELYSEKKRAYKKQKKISLEEYRKNNFIVVCPMCDGENPSSNQVCQYCSYKFKENDYYQSPNDRAYEPIDVDDEEEDGAVSGSNKLLYVIAFLVPIVGIVMGLIYIGKGEDELGKSLIIFSILIPIALAVIGWILYVIILKSLFSAAILNTFFLLPNVAQF